MRMYIARVRQRLAGMAMKMQMHGPVDVGMLVEMDPVMPHPPKDVASQRHQHNADRSLEGASQMFGDRVAKQDCGPGERKSVIV